MSKSLSPAKLNSCIVINSTVYFLIAYYFVIFSFNLFSMMLTKSLGFDVELFYYGFTHSGKEWTRVDIILVFFLGNAFTLVLAMLFERLYRKQRRYARGIKILFLWIYLIAIIWFLGNIIVGAFFNFGIGSAIRAYRIPFFLRLIFALASAVSLFYLGRNAQKHVTVSANLYFPKLLGRDTGMYFLHIIGLPVVFGLLVIILLKLPNLARYLYMDLYVLFTVVFFLAGLFFRYQSYGSVTFKTHGPDKYKIKKSNCNIAYVPLVVLIFVLAAVRIGLMNGVSI